MVNAIVGSVGYMRDPSFAAGVVRGAGTARGVSSAHGVGAVRGVNVRAAQPGVPVQPVDAVGASPRVDALTEHPEYLNRWQNDPVAMAVRGRMEYLDDAAIAKLRDESSAASTPLKAYAGAASLTTADGLEKQALLGQLAKTKTALANVVTGEAGAQGMPGSVAKTLVDAAAQEGAGAAGIASAKENNGAAAGPLTAADGVDKLSGIATSKTSKQKSAQEVAEEGKCETCEERKYQDGSDDPGVSFKNATHIDPELAAAKVRGHEQEHVSHEQANAKLEGRKVVRQSVTYHNAICPECGRVYVSGGTTRTTTAAKRNPADAQSRPTFSALF